MSKIKSITEFTEEFNEKAARAMVVLNGYELLLFKQYAEHVREVTLKEAAEKGTANYTLVRNSVEVDEVFVDEKSILSLINSENLKIE